MQKKMIKICNKLKMGIFNILFFESIFKDPTDKAFWDGLAADERRRLTMVRSTRYGFVFLSVFFFCGVVVFVWV
jgi:hypothetical protein